MTDKQQRIVFGLMAANALLFVIVFLWVGSNYRLAADDLYYLSMVDRLGAWDAMVFHYNNWSPRWSSSLLTNIFLLSSQSRFFPFAFHLCTISFGVAAIWSFLSAFRTVLRLPLNSLQIGIAATYLLAATFLVSFAKNDSWYWLSAAPSYIWASFAALFGGSLLLHSWNSILRRLLLFLFFLYAGGASESIAIFSLLTLFFIGLKTRGSATWLDSKALHLAIIACMLGFGVNMLGPGIQVRREHLPQFPIEEKLLIGFWNYIKFNLMEIPLKLPLLILLMAPFGFLGRKQLQFQLVSIKEVLWVNRTIWILADLTILILAMALGLVMSEMGPTRTWFPITLVVVSVGVVLAYQLGTWFYIQTKGRLFHLVILALVTVFGFQLFNGIDQIRKTTRYAQSVDERMNHIRQIQQDQGLVELEPLSDSGWLFSAEISTDTTHFTNKHLGLFFDHQFQFVLKDTVISN